MAGNPSIFEVHHVIAILSDHVFECIESAFDDAESDAFVVGERLKGNGASEGATKDTYGTLSIYGLYGVYDFGYVSAKSDLCRGLRGVLQAHRNPLSNRG